MAKRKRSILSAKNCLYFTELPALVCGCFLTEEKEIILGGFDRRGTVLVPTEEQARQHLPFFSPNHPASL